MLIGPEQVQAAANQLEGLMNDTVDALQQYYNHSTDLQAGGGLNGAAGMTNVVTAEEIHQAQMNIQTHWGRVIAMLRTQTGQYGETDHSNSSQIASVAGGLCT